MPLRDRRVRVRRSAVAVFGGLLAFVSLQLGLSCLLETARLRDPVYGRRLHSVQKALRSESTKPWAVVMLGTSRTSYGFRPSAAEKSWRGPDGRPVAAFNFGVNGGGPLSELLMWRRLEQDGVRPDLLLIEILPPLLGGQADPNDFLPEHWPTWRLRWGDLPLIKRYTGIHRPDLRRDWLTSFALPGYFQRCKLTNLFASDLLPYGPYALRPIDEWTVNECGEAIPYKPPTPEERRRMTQWTAGLYGATLKVFRLGGQPCAALRELLASCQQEGVPAALVYMPEGPAFRALYSREMLQEVEKWVGGLSAEYNAPVIDARSWIDEADFLESNHLLQTGADKFTDRLGREAILPLLEQEGRKRRACLPK